MTAILNSVASIIIFEPQDLYTIDYPFTGVPQYTPVESPAPLVWQDSALSVGTQITGDQNGFTIAADATDDTVVQFTFQGIIEGDNGGSYFQVFDENDQAIGDAILSGQVGTGLILISAGSTISYYVAVVNDKGLTYPARITKATWSAQLVSGFTQ